MVIGEISLIFGRKPLQTLSIYRIGSVLYRDGFSYSESLSNIKRQQRRLTSNDMPFSIALYCSFSLHYRLWRTFTSDLIRLISTPTGDFFFVLFVPLSWLAPASASLSTLVLASSFPYSLEWSMIGRESNNDPPWLDVDVDDADGHGGGSVSAQGGVREVGLWSDQSMARSCGSSSVGPGASK